MSLCGNQNILKKELFSDLENNLMEKTKEI